MPSNVLPMVSSADIYSDEKFIATAPKEILYLDISIARKYSALKHQPFLA